MFNIRVVAAMSPMSSTAEHETPTLDFTRMRQKCQIIDNILCGHQQTLMADGEVNDGH